MTKRYVGVGVVLVMLIMFGILLSHGVLTQAKTSSALDHTVYKYYTSIQIQPGDTLNSIAEEYMTAEYESTQEYVDEVISMNGLTSTTIHAGAYLTVPYYSTEKR